MKILFVGLSSPAETFLKRLIIELNKSGIEILIAYNYKPRGSNYYIPNTKSFTLYSNKLEVKDRIHWLIENIGYLIFKKPNVIFKNLFKKHITFKQSFRVILKLAPFYRHSWDLTYFPWNSTAIQYEEIFDWPQPTVISCRGAQINVAPHNPRRISIISGLKKSFYNSNAVHCVSKDIYDKSLNFNLEPKKANIITPAVDYNFFKPLEKMRSNYFKIISTGSLIWRKGYEYSLQVVKLLKNQNVPIKYTIIGSGPEKQRILFTIFDLDLENEVSILNNLSEKDIRNELQDNDAFLFSSLSEGISNSVLEAMSCGLPVVSTNCGGMNEVIEHEKDGFLTDLRDPDSQKFYLEKVFKEPLLARDIGKRARDKIINEFGISSQGKAFETMFKNEVY